MKYHLYKSRGVTGKTKKQSPRVLPVRVVAEASAWASASVEAHFGSVRVSFRDSCDPAYVVAVLSALGKC